MIETSVFYGLCELPTPTVPYRGYGVVPNDSEKTQFNRGFVDFSHLGEIGWGLQGGLPPKELFKGGFVRMDIIGREVLAREREYVEILTELGLKRVDFKNAGFKTVRTYYNQTLDLSKSADYFTSPFLTDPRQNQIPMAFHLYDAEGNFLETLEEVIQTVLSQDSSIPVIQRIPKQPTAPKQPTEPKTNPDETADAKREPDPTVGADGVQTPKPTIEEKLLDFLAQE